MAETLKESQRVLYFQHDYIDHQYDKYKFFKDTCKIASDMMLYKLIALFPMEHEIFYPDESGKNPWERKTDMQQEIIDFYKADLTMLNVNLIFGDKQSYMLHYMAQCVKKGEIPECFASETFKFHPINL